MKFYILVVLVLIDSDIASSSGNDRNLSSEIISMVRQEKHTEAAMAFNKLKANPANEALQDIISTLYAGKEENTKTIVLFLRELPYCSQIAQGHKLLLEIMEKNGDQGKPEILLLNRVGWKTCHYSFIEIQGDLAASVNNVIVEWATQIRSGDYNNITDFFDRYRETAFRFTLDLTLPKLVNMTFDRNVSNVNNILSFLYELPFCEQSIEGYKVLYKAIATSGERTHPEMLLLTGERIQCDHAFSVLTNDLILPINQVIAEWAHRIRSGDYDQITGFFHKYNQPGNVYALSMTLPELIRVAYGVNGSNVKNILEFISTLQSCVLQVEGQKNLFDAMQNSGHHQNPEILLLGRTKSFQCDSTYNELRIDFSAYVRDVVTQMESQIRSGHLAQFINFFKKYNDYFSELNLDLCLSKFTASFYDKIEEQEKQLQTILEGPSIVCNDTTGLDDHYPEIETIVTDETFHKLLKHAHAVKLYQEAIEIACPRNAPLLHKIDTLEQMNASIIQSIVWENECTIRNVMYGGYLYQGGDSLEELMGERQVFTVHKAPDLTVDDGWWKFRLTDDGVRVHVYDDSGWETGVVGSNRRIMVVDKENRWSGWKRDIITVRWADEYNMNTWNLEPIEIPTEGNVKSGRAIYYLRSGLGNHFLYAGNSSLKHDNDRRRVFAWTGTEKIPQAAQWEIDCF